MSGPTTVAAMLGTKISQTSNKKEKPKTATTTTVLPTTVLSNQTALHQYQASKARSRGTGPGRSTRVGPRPLNDPKGLGGLGGGKRKSRRKSKKRHSRKHKKRTLKHKRRSRKHKRRSRKHKRRSRKR